MKKNPVIHFELPANDRKKMADFYTGVFGWETKQLGPEMGNYVMAMTAESNEKGPINPGSINGGFYQKPKDMPVHPSFVIQVDDIKKHMKIVEKSGGKLIGELMDISGSWFICFIY